VSPRAAEKLYGVVGKTNSSGEWRADPAQSERLRAKIRKARLARAVPVKVWWRKERERIINGNIKGEAATMYAECLGHSQEWARRYREFWALPDDFSSPAVDDEQRQDKSKGAE